MSDAGKSYRDTDNPVQALSDALAFNSRDFGVEKFDAWLWGIIHGWDWDGDQQYGDPMAEVAAHVGWDDHDIARLRRLHLNWLKLERVAADMFSEEDREI